MLPKIIHNKCRPTKSQLLSLYSHWLSCRDDIFDTYHVTPKVIIFLQVNFDSGYKNPNPNKQTCRQNADVYY